MLVDVEKIPYFFFFFEGFPYLNLLTKHIGIRKCLPYFSISNYLSLLLIRPLNNQLNFANSRKEKSIYLYCIKPQPVYICIYYKYSVYKTASTISITSIFNVLTDRIQGQCSGNVNVFSAESAESAVLSIIYSLHIYC